ncbi:MAG: SufS family cysteine desulfurase [Saccharofermentans sp.]|nr:SufS family cysteine desulfurase [Saccharofermentans sp.]
MLSQYYKKDFKILSKLENDMRLVYLDNAATTQKPDVVLAAVRRYYTSDNANPHRGVYELAMRATDVHEQARSVIAAFLNAERDEEIIFTRNATEALNLVAYSYGLANLKKGDEIAVAVSEHHSNLVPWQRVSEITGAKVVYLYPDEHGDYTKEELTSKIGRSTKILAMAHVSNVLGIENPVKLAAGLVHQNGGIAVIDCAQSVAHMKVDVRDIDADFVAFSGHKIYAPMGIGVLYGKYELLDKMPPFLSGGDMISHVHESGATYAKPPRKFEAGTCNLGDEAGLVEAIRYVEKIGLDKIREHETELCKKALEGLNSLGGIDIYPAGSDKARSLISFNIRGVHPHDAATIMDSFGVCVRAGHHCAEPLMERLGIGSCLRASFALYNDMDDVDIFIRSVEQTRKVMGIGS